MLDFESVAQYYRDNWKDIFVYDKDYVEDIFLDLCKVDGDTLKLSFVANLFGDIPFAIELEYTFGDGIEVDKFDIDVFTESLKKYLWDLIKKTIHEGCRK